MPNTSWFAVPAQLRQLELFAFVVPGHSGVAYTAAVHSFIGATL